jgi:hypothetical protein
MGLRGEAAWLGDGVKGPLITLITRILCVPFWESGGLAGGGRLGWRVGEGSAEPKKLKELMLSKIKKSKQGDRELFDLFDFAVKHSACESLISSIINDIENNISEKIEEIENAIENIFSEEIF